MPIVITDSTLKKLADKHKVTLREVEQCFDNKEGGLLKDTREENQTTPPTLWFLAYTNKNRLLKIVFIQIDDDINIKTAYEANDDEIRIYRKYAM